jgi:hypothetical protein
MMRNLIALSCAGLLTIGLSFSSFAGSVVDVDGDAIPDNYDNCLGVANGPGAPPDVGACDTQMDADLDGFGNACDRDSNQDGNILADDLSDVLGNWGGAEPKVDHNCDGNILADDLSLILGKFGGGPGPSGLACADPLLNVPPDAPCIAE